MSAVRVSAVVPVWNPGPSFHRCVESLLAQTLPPEQYEIVLVDDGSTDGTAERLDRLTEQHPELIRVHHIPASGWPGKPRNVGIDAARGEFVHLVDNDDTLPPYALQAMVDAGTEHGADVVMGRPASDFRGLVHNIYRTPFWCGPLREFPDLTTTLTPHKMFRRALLVEHGIRFPEGPVPLEDQMFVMAAYLHAGRIAVLSDRIYYSYLRRLGFGRNAGDQPIDAPRQSRAVEQVLDIVEACTDDDAFRDRLFRRFYRINLLSGLANRTVLDGDPESRDTYIDEIRRVTVSRFGPGVTGAVGAPNRIQGRLLVERDTPGLIALAHRYADVGLRLVAERHEWHDGVLHLDFAGGIVVGDDLLRAELTDRGWALPVELAPGVPVADRLLDDRDEADLELSLLSRAAAASFAADSDVHIAVDDDGYLRATGQARIDPQRALVGRPLDDGVWDLRGRLRFGGWNRACRVRVPDDTEPGPRACVTADGRVVLIQLVRGTLQLDVGQWTTSFAAAVAPTTELRADGTGLVLDAGVLVGAPLPVELVLRPERTPPGRGTGGLVVADGELRPTTEGSTSASVRFPLPDLRRGGYQVWLRTPDQPADEAEALPWSVHAGDGNLRVTAVPPD